MSVSYLIFHQAKSELEKKTQVYFDFRVREAVERIQTRMHAYEQVLLGAAGLFKSSQSVERNEFKDYVTSLNLSAHYPGIQGVGFSLKLSPESVTEHIANIRKEGFENYTVWPDGQRHIYTSIIYLEPFSGRNLRAFGYDMFSEPVRHEAMQKSIDTGQANLSGKIKLVQETEENVQAGFLMYLPIYFNGSDIATRAGRRKNIQGWVYAPFRMNDLMEGVLGEQADDLSIRIYDGDQLSDKALMYASHDAETPSLDLSKTISLNLANHPWTIHVRPLPAINARVNSNHPDSLLIISSFVSLLLAALIWFLVSGRERAIHAAKRMNSNLIHQRQRLTNIIEGTRAGTWEWNVQTGETHFNENWAKMIGYELSELKPTSIETWLKFVHPEDGQKSEELLNKHFVGELDYYECEARMRHKDGHWIWVLDRGKVTTWTPDGKPLLMAGTHQDISVRKELELELTRQAHIDHLTGLANRRYFLNHGDVEMIRAIRYDKHLSLMMIDIDYFKEVNDTYGHQAGDTILQNLGRLFKDSIRMIDVAGRLGGEEFAILLPETPLDEALLVAERLREKIASLQTIFNDVMLKVTISIGIATLNGKVTNLEMLLNHADKALYASKNMGRNRVSVF